MSGLLALSDLKLMLSKGDRPGLWSPAAVAHPYAGLDAAVLRHWLVGESVFPSFTTVSTDGSTTTTSRTINIGSPANGNYSLIVHRTAAASTITLPGGWTGMENVASASAGDQVAVGYKLCDGTEGATATVTHGSSVRSITQAFVIVGAGTPVYSQYVRDISNVGSVAPFTDPLLGGVQPGVRRLFLVFCTTDSQGEVIADVPSGYINGGAVSNSGAGGAGQANILYGYKWAVSNAEETATFPMPDLIAGGAHSINFGIVVGPA